MKNIQFNSTSAKAFRETLSKYNDAQHGLNDYICSKSERVKSLKTMLETNERDLARLSNGDKTVMRSVETIRKESADFQSKLDAESKALSDARNECAKRLEDAEKLVTEELYNSAMTDSFAEEFAKFLQKNGLSDATSENVPKLNFGTKKNSAKKAFNDGTLMGKLSFKPWRTLFLCTLCDTLVENKAISPYKYNYVKPEKKHN